MITLNLDELDVAPAPPAPTKVPRRATADTAPTTDVPADIELLLVAAEATPHLFPDDYGTWTKTGFALATQGEAGRESFHRLSRLSAKYDQDQTDKKFDEALKKGNGSVSIGTLFHLAKEAGIKTPKKQRPINPRITRASRAKALRQVLEAKGHHPTPQQLADAMTMATNAKKDGRANGGLSTLTHTADPLPGNPEAASIVVDEAQNSPAERETLFGQLREFIQDDYPLRRNVVTRRIELRGRPIEDADVNDIYVAAAMLVNEKITKAHVEAVVYSNFVEPYNPITDYFENNKVLRVGGSIERLANTIQTSTGFDNQGNPDPEYFAYFLTKWLIGIVASAHGQHSPLLLALTGGQATGKTEWLRRLLPNELKYYYAESKLDAGKDDEILMTQKLLICDDEMGGKSKRDKTRLKELTSKQTFTLREPYGRANVDLQRLAVLCGTSNSPDLLNDPTGNRRIIPLDVLSIDHAAYNAISKDEVLMEAYHLWKEGHTHHLNAEDIQRLGYQGGAFQGTVLERELIQVRLKVPDNGMLPVEYLTNSEILEYLSPGGALRLSPKVVGQQLKALGFERKNYYQPGKGNRYCYAVMKAEMTVRPEDEACKAERPVPSRRVA